MRRTWLLRLAGALIVLVGVIALPFSTASANVSPHGANSLETPHVYVDFWGPEWPAGSQYANYLINFVSNLGTDPSPLNPLLQYGLQNAAGLYAGSWTDVGNDPPAKPTVDDYGAEVARAAEHFGDAGGGQNVNDIILVATPAGHDPASFPSNGGNVCGYHTYSQFTFGGLGPTPWIALPYQPDAPNCFQNSGNSSDNSFGNGYLDGVSKVAYHEIAETISDYDMHGWYQQNTAGEVADLCNSQVANYGAPNSGEYFAVQSVWSNSSGGCAYGTAGSIVLSGNIDFGSQQVYTAAAPQIVTATNNGDADIITGPGTPWVLTDGSHSYSLSDSTCPQVLHPSASCQVSVQFSPHLFGAAAATLQFEGTSATITGTGTIGELLHTNFTVKLGGVSILGGHVIRTLSVINEGKSVVTFKPAFLRGIDASDFSIPEDGCATASLRFGTSCSLQLRFAPATTGDRSVQVVLPSSQALLGGVIEGFGTGPIATVTGRRLRAGTLSFAETDGLDERPSSSVSIKNTGQAALTISRISASGDFRKTSDCPKVLRVGTSCAIHVQLYPRHYNWQTGTLTIAENGSATPQEIALRGSVDGTWAAANPGHVNFGSVAVGASAAQPIQLIGLESGLFRIKAVKVSGGFTITNKCPSVLKAPACTITVRIKPKKAGKLSGILTIVTGASNGTVRVPLSALARKA
jgi:hypothetical protein